MTIWKFKHLGEALWRRGNTSLEQRNGAAEGGPRSAPGKGELSLSVIQACTGVKEIEVVERLVDLLQRRIDKVHVGGEVLINTV